MLLLPVASAQVTIGSHVPPRTGSLLDLKENNKEEKNANSEKGLGLPRVELESLDKLTIGKDESKKENYVGTMVYNTTNNNNIKEGTYCWMGSTWMQAVIADGKGSAGTILKSNGDGTYGWSEVTIPDYKYHKPTNVGGMKEKNTKTYQFEFSKLLNSEEPDLNFVWKADENAFKNTYVYKDTIDIMTGDETQKYMLLGTTVFTTKKLKSGNVSLQNTVWESIIIEVILTKINDNGTYGKSTSIKQYNKTINTPSGGNPTGYLDHFSIIRFPTSTFGLEKGKYELKLRVANVRNTFAFNTKDPNLNPNSGNFHISTSPTDYFYTIGIEDINFVLYEYE